MYTDFIHEYENLGHMTRLDPSNNYGTPHCFLPHHGVFRAHSTTTKLRVVFDASFPSSTSISFNNLQRIGPPIQGDIPRLELSGAVLSARLFKKISDSLRCKFNKVVFWTDSTIVLGWLQMAPNLLKTFVQNRVVEILELTGELPWRHVSGKDNPADMASRGVLLNDLATSKLWWNGPQFLHDPIFNDTIISSETKNILTCEELPEVKSSSKLNLFIDEKCDLIRVGGRIANSTEFEYNKMHPILLSDPRDFLPLTPAYFLVGRSLTAPVYEDMRHNTGTSLSRYKRLEQIRHHFWERWSKEYISELQTRCKWMSGVDTLQPGMMVIIKDDNLPPLRWQLGRITNAVPGKDGISRVADIRTATGVVRRSFAKICPLFFEDETTKTMKIT
ncbi:uncharacterized protein LOC120631072 [Pararge aegeria]|uniref:uncharacterized protein LOC120631072 n=1 Tax=Pararge aegeria TaxID=116150 RepID=UPI0019D06BB4|nr:uncharacterized protein LOC120631072 [Pararge aegeria]